MIDEDLDENVLEHSLGRDEDNRKILYLRQGLHGNKLL